MAKKQTLTVTTEFGTFTRTTARTYTHVVIASGRSDTAICARLTWDLKLAKQNRRYYQGMLDGTEARANCYSHGVLMTDDMLKARVAELQAEIEAIEAGTKLDAEIAKSAAATFGDLGWCGRLDLARKLAAPNVTEFRKVLIIDVATGKAVA